jgi:hypothetical protein
VVARVNTVAFQGIDVVDVDVQVQIASGLPAFSIVGLPDKAVAESRERVRSALNALGLALPPKRITVNLAPADLAKEGSHFDLPIALGLLAAMDVLPGDEMAGVVALGELALDGRVSPAPGSRGSTCWRRPRLWSWSIISRAPRSSHRPNPGPKKTDRRGLTSPTSRVRKPPSGRSRSPLRAAITC